jgi:hypothetical protein
LENAVDGVPKFYFRYWRLEFGAEANVALSNAWQITAKFAESGDLAQQVHTRAKILEALGFQEKAAEFRIEAINETRDALREALTSIEGLTQQREEAANQLENVRTYLKEAVKTRAPSALSFTEKNRSIRVKVLDDTFGFLLKTGTGDCQISCLASVHKSVQTAPITFFPRSDSSSCEFIWDDGDRIWYCGGENKTLVNSILLGQLSDLASSFRSQVNANKAREGNSRKGIDDLNAR